MKIINNIYSINHISNIRKKQKTPSFQGKIITEPNTKKMLTVTASSLGSIGLILNQNETSGIKNNTQLFLDEILSNKDNETDKFFKEFDFAQYEKKGVPLKYSRDEFLAKIKELISNLPEPEQKVILNHFGILITNEGFEGLISNNPFKNKDMSPNAQTAAQNINEEVKKFAFNNIVTTGNNKTDKTLTMLIKSLPEFTTIIGKEQHETHNYSVDIHTFKVLQSALNHPLYEKLSDESKIVLKTAILLHDLGKKEKVIDDDHAALSTIYASKILERFPLNGETKSRITNIIKNHHWFAAYNQDFTKVEDVISLCKHPEDILIYIISAKGDFENVNERFHLKRSNFSKNQEEFDAYIENKMQPLVDAYNKLSS